MKWIKSFLHKGIIGVALKRFVWVGGSYFMALMLLLPLRIMMRLPSHEEPHFYPETFTRMYEFSGEPFQMFLMLTVPFITAILVFQYLQQKSSSDFLHSIPMTRKTMFWSHLISGVLLWALPVALIGGISFLIRSLTVLNQYLAVETIWQWMGTTLLMNFVIYLSTVTVGMFSGVVLAQGIFAYILLLLPAGMLILMAYNLNILLYGFSGDFLMQEEYLVFSPIIRIFGLYAESLSFSEVRGYLVACVLLLVASRTLYQYRRMERCRQTVVFNGINTIFLLGITFCVMLTGGLYAEIASRGNVFWILIAYALFAVIGHYIALAVLNKSFRVFNRKNLKSFAIYAAITGMIMTGIVTDVTGYEQRIPKVDDIEKVYFDGAFWRYENWKTASEQEEWDYFYRQSQSIERILKLHEAIIQESNWFRFKGNQYNSDTRRVALAYHLKDGSRQVREYRVSHHDFEEYFQSIQGLMEDKEMEFPVLRLQPEDVSHIEFRAGEMDKRKILQQEEAEEVLSIIQEEIKRADYDTLYGPSDSEGSIRIHLTDRKQKSMPPYYGDRGQLYVDRNRNFEALDQWLKDKDHYDEVTVVPEDIAQVSVRMVESENEMEVIERNGFIEIGDGISTKDVEEIEASLNRSSSFWRAREYYPVYVVGFFDEFDNQLFIRAFEPGQLPEFIYMQ